MEMNFIHRFVLASIITCGVLSWGACTTQTNNSNTATTQAIPSPSASPSPASKETSSQLTLPVLDALLANESFLHELKSQAQLTDKQIDSLKQIAGSEVARLRQTNSEQMGGAAADARTRTRQQLTTILGEEKAQQLISLATESWARGLDYSGETNEKEAPAAMPTTPNSVPGDTRVVVNIPAFRMDLFKNGSLIKSYKIGIGYPEFPLPQGLRKAQSIIFNPTWTPPDSPWVATMKDISPGEKVEAGSKLNPLGPVKIPIGMPSLIHGGKSAAKLGQFASHGCVGLTNTQVKDFALLLAQASETELSDKSITSYLDDKTRTKVVKLSQMVPVELRYETIVVEDGKLHIYKDVYEQGTNTEENLQSVLAAHSSRLEDLSEDERRQALNALNAMSAHPKLATVAYPQTDSANSNSSEQTTVKKAKPTSSKKAAKNQKEIVVEIASLADKGYPAPVNLDTGTGKPPATLAGRSRP